MNEIREMINISYFDNKNTTLKEHCDIYSNIKKEVLEILNKYDIKYVVVDTESVRDLVKENEQLKEQLERSEKVRKEAIELLEKHLEARSYSNHKYEFFSREYLEELLKILDINKGE